MMAAAALGRGAFFMLLMSISTALSISLTENVAQNSQSPLPASRMVDLKLFHVAPLDRQSFEQTHRRSHPLPNHRHVDETRPTSFFSLLRRRDGLTIYGKDIVHSADEPNYATLTMFQNACSRSTPRSQDAKQTRTTPTTDDGCSWDATLLLLTKEKDKVGTSGSSNSHDSCCFVAMNRFAVKEGCQHLFEQRWAERQSKLADQAGFLSFCLLRQRTRDDCSSNSSSNVVRTANYDLRQQVASFNYSSLTLWESFDVWKAWRNGMGRYSHDASRTQKRTPVSEWLERSASPIFWDGIGTVMAESGI